ncbi:MAG: ferredoxin [Spirochaetae bacterium HGW-Spirochaetae-9]|nr:MAG: ferredoxin [Spirochaetae bacterium HGW-Spirochaetae-9]
MRFTPVDAYNASVAKPAALPARILHIDLLAIDLSSCARCVPTASQLEAAMEMLKPAAAALGIGFDYRPRVLANAAEALEASLLSSPTIRLNGRDIGGELRESVCETCGDLIGATGSVDCREWVYRGETYCTAPVPLILEAMMDAMVHLDERPPVAVPPLENLPENLKGFFEAKRNPVENKGCC